MVRGALEAASRQVIGSDSSMRRASPPLSTLANAGKATLGDFAVLGIRTRAQLARRDAYRLYETLCARTGARHDPCVIDVFLATISECRGHPPREWWRFTPERKRALAADPGLAPTATRSAGA